MTIVLLAFAVTSVASCWAAWRWGPTHQALTNQWAIACSAVVQSRIVGSSLARALLRGDLAIVERVVYTGLSCMWNNVRLAWHLARSDLWRALLIFLAGNLRRLIAVLIWICRHVDRRLFGDSPPPPIC
jgi:hypothetical protein